MWFSWIVIGLLTSSLGWLVAIWLVLVLVVGAVVCIGRAMEALEQACQLVARKTQPYVPGWLHHAPRAPYAATLRQVLEENKP